MMATSDDRPPRARGARFRDTSSSARQTSAERRPAPSHAAHNSLVNGAGDATAPRNANGASAPSATGATAPRSALSGGRVSSRTASATRRAGAHHVQRDTTSRRRSRAPFFVLGLVVVAVLLAIVFVVVPAVTGSSDGDTQEIEAGITVNVTVAEGAGASTVAQTLYDAGVIESTSEFLAMVKRLEAEQSIKSGAYVFVTGQDLSDIINQLVEGPNAGVTLTVPEGYTVASIAELVEATFSISADEFIEQAKASNYVADYEFLEDVGNDSLEGFLFPKTYSFTDEDVTADEIIRTMLSQFETELATLDLSYPESLGLSVADLVNLASIVEKESTSSTRATVAAVFYNRLNNFGEPNYGYLQSDATTAYSVGHDPTAEEVHDEDDPYSTYTNTGLPPTPICNPGLEALEAVCSPDTDAIENGIFYFFFWTNDDGETEYAFSSTYEEHLQAIAEHS